MQTTINAQILVIWLLLLGFSAGAMGAGPEARLDRTRIGEGETVVLSVTLPGASLGKPDLSALAKDFDILNHSQSMQMSMINGRSSSSQTWQFVLAPKRSGRLDVPAIAVGGVSTRPLSLEVLPAAEAAKLGPAAPVLLEIEAEPKQPYVQQKVIYTVRLLSRAPLRQADVSEPSIRDAMVERLGAEREYNGQREGQQYRVIERRYAVFPQRSGPLEIDGPLLSAQLPEQNQRGNAPGQRFPGPDPFAGFDRLFGRGGFPDIGAGFTQTRPIRLRGRKLVLDVQAQPAGTASPWLPAESLSLNDSWSSDPPVFRVGEPITRTIAITAQGLTANQLPEAMPEAPAGIKVYPDKSQSHTRVDGDTLVAQKVLKAALVPSHAGSIVLPGMRLAWWDTRNKRQQLARLPAREVEVLPAADGSSTPAMDSPPPVARPAAVQPRPIAAEPARSDATGAVSRDENDSATGSRYWPWLAAVLGLAWLVTTVLWLLTRRASRLRPGIEAPPPAASLPNSGRLLARVEQACRANDARAARQALLAWAAARWPHDSPQAIDTLAQRLGEDAAQALRDLDRSLYSGANQPWDGVVAWSRLSPALEADRRSKNTGRRDSSLPPLYPQGS